MNEAITDDDLAAMERDALGEAQCPYPEGDNEAMVRLIAEVRRLKTRITQLEAAWPTRDYPLPD